MGRCNYHPGRESVSTIGNNNYCAQCQQGITAAVRLVDTHVEPKACFVWYAAANNWQPITGTGCAHWVAHQLGARSTGGGAGTCLLGFTYRVRTLILGKRTVALADLRTNDIYVTPHVDHTGLVSRIIPANAATNTPQRIFIRHDSSAQGGVAENEFSTYFHGLGTFYR
jgi:hypothetical protein